MSVMLLCRNYYFLSKTTNRSNASTYLEEGLLVEDGAGDVVANVGGSEKEATVRLAVSLGVLHVDPVQTLADGLGRLIHGQDTLACMIESV